MPRMFRFAPFIGIALSLGSCTTEQVQPPPPTTTTTITGCETATGCKATDSATTTTTSVCSIPTGRFQKRSGNSCGQWAVVYPVDNVDNAANSAIDSVLNDEVRDYADLAGRA